MTRVILIPTGQTDWRDQGRLSGKADLPLNQLGHRQAVADAEAIAGLTAKLIYCGTEQGTRQTAALIADQLNLKLKKVKDLREMDVGHWEGLTIEDFHERFPTVHKQWQSDPTAVEPPEGEAVEAAASRLEKAVQKLVKNAPDETVAVVLGRFAYAILRCRLQDKTFENFWDYVDGDLRWHTVEVAPPPTPAKRSPGVKRTPPPGQEPGQT